MRITYQTPSGIRSDLIIESDTKYFARFLFTELYPHLKFKKATKMNKKSPVTGKPMKKKALYSYIVIRGEKIGYKQEFWYCEESKERFTDAEMDVKNLNRALKAAKEAKNNCVKPFNP